MSKTALEGESRPIAAWIVTVPAEVSFCAAIPRGPEGVPAIRPGDGLLLVEGQGEAQVLVGVARAYRIRRHQIAVEVYLDIFQRLAEPLPIQGTGLKGPIEPAKVARLELALFDQIVQRAMGRPFGSLPVLSDEKDGRFLSHLREMLQAAVEDDLLGPADGPEESVVGMDVRSRYLVGRLAPKDLAKEEGDGEADEELIAKEGHHSMGGEFDKASGDNDPDEQETDSTVANQSLLPNSVGVTCCVDGSVQELEVEVRWGRYVRAEEDLTEEVRNEKTGETKTKKYRVWRRIPSGGVIKLRLPGGEGPLDERELVPDPACPKVRLSGVIRAPLPDGNRMLTVFLVNDQERPDKNQDAAWVFQPQLTLRDPKARAIFHRRPPLKTDRVEPERSALEMVYRRRLEFAVGHGISVHAEPTVGDPERSGQIRTSVLPAYEVGATETPGAEPDDRPLMRELAKDGRLDMRSLAKADKERVIGLLEAIVADYGKWIREREQEAREHLKGYEAEGKSAVTRCDEVLNRLMAGIETLKGDVAALEAFRFANRVMADQRVRSVYALKRRRGQTVTVDEVDVPQNRTWRPFQLAFMLLSVPSLTDPRHADRTGAVTATADLLWFPTGGGKTEAYLGVAAFAMAIRRLKKDLGDLDGSRGLCVIMRYTLRLLTLQQFQRASTLLCAMEVERSLDTGKWGAEPFGLGLWVGRKVTPNSTKESHEAIEAERKGKARSASTPAQLTNCPWCGSPIQSGRDIEVDLDVGRTIVYCGDVKQQCPFSKAKAPEKGLPVSVVDEELYHRPPSMLIATVDKFAMMAWRGETRTLFGVSTRECPRHGLAWPDSECHQSHPKKGKLPAVKVGEVKPLRPPDLVIQDEFHLISGPLGTMVGLYESTIDRLCSWKMGDKVIRPKVIASTATVRRASDQVRNVFMRKVAVFPPHGLVAEDNYFSIQRPVRLRYGRRYMGISAPGTSRPAALIRVYVAVLTAARAIFDHFGRAADPWMTGVGYFNALRELGGMRRLAEDDVKTRCYRVLMSKVARPGLAQRDLKTIDELTSRVSSREIPLKLDALEVPHKREYVKGEARAIDVVLATNMLSVGVDVNRLGLMIVNGQPKTTAEYIQASSRVGRSHPGMVFTVLNWARPRDLSHYETFEHYHATFYKHVEAQSVTPFSPRALDRGLTGTLVSSLRLSIDELNPNEGAERLVDPRKPPLLEAVKGFADRAGQVRNQEVAKLAEDWALERLDRWSKEATKAGRKLGYEAERGEGTMAGLLRKPGLDAWGMFTVPMSMREVEPGVRLIMELSDPGETPAWTARPAGRKDAK